MATKGNPNLANIDASAKAELRVGSRVCQCASCGLFFTGVAPFDRHLTGQDEGDTDCLSVPQMQALGMVQNVNGVWQYGKSKKVMEAA